MRVTDAQVHIWEAHHPDRPRGMGSNFLLADLEKALSEADVDRAVLFPMRWEGYPGGTLAGNDYSFEAARLQPHRFAVIANLDLERPDALAQLAGLMARPGMKGIRLNLRWERAEDMEHVWPEVARLGIPVAVFAKEGRLPPLVPVLERHPEITFLIDHVNLPALGPDPWVDLHQVLDLARLKNVVVKASAMTRRSKEPYPFSDIHHHIRRLYDTFGPERLAWGSDYSWEVGRITYRESVDLIREACDFLSTSDRQWMLDKTLSRVLRWDD